MALLKRAVREQEEQQPCIFARGTSVRVLSISGNGPLNKGQ